MADNSSMTFRLFGVDVSASRALKGVGRQAKKTAKDVDGVGGSAARAGGHVDGLSNMLKKGFGSVASAGVHTMAAGFTAVAAAAGFAAGAIFKAGIQTASFNEQATVSLTTLLKSSDAARAHLEELQAFSQRTPFDMPGLIEADRLLLGIGIRARDTIPYLTLWGDASSALGLSQEQFSRIMLANTQAMSAGRYQIEDLNQITENGVPIYTLLSQALGKSIPQIRKMATEGKLTTDVFSRLFPVMQQNYTGAMEDQSKTLAGVWSNLKETFNQGSAKALTAALPEIKQAMNDLIPAMATFFTWLGDTGVPAMMTFGGELRDRVLPSLKVLAGYLYDNRELIGQFAQAFLATMDILGPLLVGLAISFGGSMKVLMGMIRGLGMALAWLLDQTASAVGTLARVLPPSMAATARSAATSMHQAAQQMKADFDAIADPTITFHVRTSYTSTGLPGGSLYESQVPGAAGPARRMTTVRKTGSGVRIPDLSYIGGGGGGGGTGGGGGGGSSAAATTRKNAVKAIRKELTGSFRQAIYESRAALSSAFGSLLEDIAKTGSKKAKAIANAAKKTLLALASRRDGVSKALTAWRDKLKSLQSDAQSMIASVKASVIESGNVTKGNQTWEGIVYDLRSAVYRARLFADALARLKKAGLNKTTLDQLAQAGPDALQAARSILDSGKGGIGLVNGLEKQLETSGKAAGTTAANSMYAAGIAAAQGMVKGLASQEKAIEALMRRIADRMAAAIRRALGIKSPSRVFAQIGGHVGQGLIDGMVGKQSAVAGTAGALLSAGLTGSYSGAGRGFGPGVTGAARGDTYIFQLDRALVGNEQHVARVVSEAMSRVTGRGGKVRLAGAT